MKSKIKNISPSSLSLFVRNGGVESKIELGSGKELAVDNYETRTIKIYIRKKLITMEPIVLDQKTGNINLQYNPENVQEVETPNQETGTERLDVVEGEVKRYVEDGYIKGEWSEEDMSFLKKNYPTKGRTYCSVELNRNESSVQKKINSLGLKKKKKK